MKKMTIEELLFRANKIYNNKYDYSKVEYIDYLAKIIIICPIHGEFETTFFAHLYNSRGCLKCKKNENQIKLKEQFIKKAQMIHGNKYDYSKVEYIDSKTKIIIICPIHGEFLCKCRNHLIGYGCCLCAKILRQTKKLEQYISKANILFNNKYDYSKTKYAGRGNKVIIICPIHGEFLMTFQAHLQGCGCPKCKKIILDDDTLWDSLVEAYYYLIYKKQYEIIIPHKVYGEELRLKMCDFYIPKINLYVEITSLNKKYYEGAYGKPWKIYINNIKRKKYYVEKILKANFKFIQSKGLTIKQLTYLHKHITSNQTTILCSNKSPEYSDETSLPVVNKLKKSVRMLSTSTRDMHHLYWNNGLLFLNWTERHNNTSVRMRASLHTKDIVVAKQLRDNLLGELKYFK